MATKTTKKTTTRSKPVVATKKEIIKDQNCGCAMGKACTCGTDCKCGDSCACGKDAPCQSKKCCKKFLAKSAVLLIAAAMISGSILYAGNCGCSKMKGMKPRSMNPEMQAKFKEKQDEAISNFIKENPQFIIDTINNYTRSAFIKNAPKKEVIDDKKKDKTIKKEPATPVDLSTLKPAPADIVKQIVNDKTNYSLGNPKGSYVIIEFFDYQCGWCKRTNVAMSEALKKAEAKNIRWIPIDTPIFGGASETIARYVLAAGEQGKYAQMHDAVTNASGRLNETALIELGKTLKLDTKKLQKDANGDKITKKLADNKKYTKELGIGGVPMLIVNGKINRGALLGDKLDAVIQESNKK